MSLLPIPAPVAGVEQFVAVWNKIDWSPEIEQGIYKDWGKYYSGRSRESIANVYFDKALNLCPNDFMALYYRSQSKRKTAEMEGALKDSREAVSILKNKSVENAPINLEICDALYELNQFENAKAELHNNTRIFSGNKTMAFHDRLMVVDENIKDACGDGLSPFILENEKVMSLVKQLLNEQMKIDNRPQWKILREQGKCDILSIPEIEVMLLSPLEIARRKRAFDISNQVYIDRSWIDILFLKDLRKNPNLLLDQCKNTKAFLSELTVNQYEVIKKFMKMINARSPMYYVRYRKYTNKERLNKFREALLYRIQYQTHRNMVSALQNIRRLRATKNLLSLSNYIEDVMGKYVVLKTNRIMPWKFEFVNEMYNTLGLALSEQYFVPKSFNPFEKVALLQLLRHNPNKSKEIFTFVFGDRSTHQDQDSVDPALTKSREMISHYEKRMVFAKYSIEKCYLLHQIASIHLKANRNDECCFVARKAIQETKNCNSHLWNFLSTIIIVKANAALNKVERTKEDLEKALSISRNLNSPTITEFVETCIACNERIQSNSKSIISGRRESKLSNRSSLQLNATDIKF